jgi:hypothetical protein
VKETDKHRTDTTEEIASEKVFQEMSDKDWARSNRDLVEQGLNIWFIAASKVRDINVRLQLLERGYRVENYAEDEIQLAMKYFREAYKGELNENK